MELLLASLTGRLANDGEFSKDDGLQGLLCCAARLRLKLTLLIALDVLITLGVATRKKNIKLMYNHTTAKTVVEQLGVKNKMYSRKIWRGIKFDGLAVNVTTAKLKSAKISYSHIHMYGNPVPNRQI